MIQLKVKRYADGNDGAYAGVVSAIGSEWVELAPGWESFRDKATGKALWDVNESKKPKRISASGTNVGGDPNAEGSPTYRLSDLKVGDQVMIMTHSNRAKEEWCATLWLNRRPGGKIPPRPDEPFPERYGDHLQNQAEQDWEEKGIPIPVRFLSNGRAPWTKPPYPPVAPQPREVKR